MRRRESILFLFLLLAGFGGVVFAAHAQVVSPLAPTGVTATFSPPFHVAVSWAAPANATSVVGYYVYRNGAMVANTSGLSYLDTVPAQGYYTYTVAAGYGATGGPSALSAPSSLSILADTAPPTAPTGLTVTALTSSSVALSWNAASDNVGVAGYYLIRNSVRINLPVVISGTTYTDTSLPPDDTYTYNVVAYDGAQNTSGVSNMVRVTTFPAVFTISPPFNATAVAVSTSEIDLSWGAATDVSGTPAYYIYRNGLPLTSTTATSYRNTGLAAGMGYGYYVTAFDAVGNISPGSNQTATSTFPAPASTSSVAANSPTTGVSPAQSANVASRASATTTSGPFATTLYLGLRGDSVKMLQNVLVAQGDLGANYATGFFGALTQKAVQQFQCSQNIVCSGSQWATGWGMVGAKTRKALNALR
jgi:chitodextrinase